MKVGAIDIGTNSVRLLIAEKGKEVLNRLVEKMKVPRLGEDINQTGYLKETAIERTIEVLTDYKAKIDSFGAVPFAVATSAVRDASNQAEFINRVKKELDIKISPVSGEEEAYLSYLGVVSELDKLTEKMLIVDIGGGSTELISGRSEELLNYNSINIGAVRLKEEIGENIEQLKDKVTERVSFLTKNFNQLVGVGGTITTLAAVKQELKSYNRNKVHGISLSKQEIKQMLIRLSKLSLSSREKVPGLSARRADIIIPGIVILLEIMNQVSIEELTVSDAGLLEGIVYKNI